MKQLNYYNKLGKSSEEEIFNYFLTTLKDSIYTGITSHVLKNL